MKHYTRPSKETYLQYHTNATRLLLDVSEYCKVHVSQLTFDLIIEFFEANFNIRFVYFESDLMYKWFPDKKQTIKYRLTSKSTLFFS